MPSFLNPSHFNILKRHYFKPSDTFHESEGENLVLGPNKGAASEEILADTFLSPGERKENGQIYIPSLHPPILILKHPVPRRDF
jgi:hypothetical protein